MLIFVYCLQNGCEGSVSLPMCLMCCPTTFPLTREVTRRLLSQWPPLKSNLPSWETTNSPAVTSTPGAKGLDKKRWVLNEDNEKTTRKMLGKMIRELTLLLLYACCSHLELDTVGSLMKVK